MRGRGIFLKNAVKTVAFFLGIVYNIKAVCRDGGAVERARFEIVLCRNVYKGSNPFLCAKKIGKQIACLFFMLRKTPSNLRLEGVFLNTLYVLSRRWKKCVKSLIYISKSACPNLSPSVTISSKQ